MKRFYYFVVLMLLSSSAHAGNSFSFVVGGHRIRIEAPRHCSSPSCLSVSIPGIYQTRRRDDKYRDRYDDIDASPAAAPAKPLAPAPMPASQPATVSLASKPSAESAVSAPPRQASVGLAASTTQEVAAQPTIQSPKIQPITAPIETPADAAPPAPAAAPQVLKISHDANEESTEMPLGDWQTEGNKGSVRIEQCGAALCGYVLDPSSNTKGETVLVNMKPKAAALWSGNIYSRDSGNSYYATMAMKGTNSLRVEACAVGRFFCSGNLWSRIAAQPEKLVTSRQISSEPRS
jgi:uncharacterized protein (DUF2147 family)